MKLKLIACEVLFRELSLLASKSPNYIDVEFLEKGLHEKSDILRKHLQDRIDKTNEPYEAIIMGYGLCGNSAAGLKAGKLPIVIPRVHDCAAIFLGSHDRFKELMGDNPSQEWTSPGYMERGDNIARESEMASTLGIKKTLEEFINEYGEENGKFLFEQLNPKHIGDKFVYIETGIAPELNFRQRAEDYAREKNLKLVEYKGDISMMRDLIDGKWDEKRFQIVRPGKSVKAVYGDEVIREE